MASGICFCCPHNDFCGCAVASVRNIGGTCPEWKREEIAVTVRDRDTEGSFGELCRVQLLAEEEFPFLRSGGPQPEVATGEPSRKPTINFGGSHKNSHDDPVWLKAGRRDEPPPRLPAPPYSRDRRLRCTGDETALAPVSCGRPIARPAANHGNHPLQGDGNNLAHPGRFVNN